MTQTDHLVAAYLARVERAASRLPAGRREELLGDLREHIEISRSESAAESEAEIRTILDRLGDPESIVAAADTQTDLPRVPPAPVTAPPFPPAAPSAPARPAGRGLRPLWIVLGALAVLGMVMFCLATALFRVDGSGPREDFGPVPAERAPAPERPVTSP